MTSSHIPTIDEQCLIGLINPKSPTNVGAVLRACGCYGAHGIRYTGSRYNYAKGYATDTKNNHKHISQLHCQDVFEGLPDTIKKIAFELVEGATPLPLFEHPDHAIYVFGPEDGTIDQATINACDEVVYVPTIGCMNLAASVNVLLYDRLTKSSNTQYGNEIIMSSRDTNNRTKRSFP